jgi:PhnB protein
MSNYHVIPYLAVHDGRAALEFYEAAFGAVEAMKVIMDDGRVGHAEFHIGGAPFYLSDEFPEIGVVSPRTLGGTSFALHLTVPDVDAMFERAVGAGATGLTPPADQPHGNRHGTLLDPFGHRWMVSQPTEAVSASTYAERVRDSGATVEVNPSARRREGGIWASVNYADAEAGIRFMTEVLGFEPVLVVPGEEPGVIAHSELRWPEGGTIQASSASRGNVFTDRPTGAEAVYVITADPIAVHDRCVRAGAEIIAPLESPHYDPEGIGFSTRDPEGNIWSFGTYAGEASQ